jgi:hypothetical protein
MITGIEYVKSRKTALEDALLLSRCNIDALLNLCK